MVWDQSLNADQVERVKYIGHCQDLECDLPKKYYNLMADVSWILTCFSFWKASLITEKFSNIKARINYPEQLVPWLIKQFWTGPCIRITKTVFCVPFGDSSHLTNQPRSQDIVDFSQCGWCQIRWFGLINSCVYVLN